MKTRSAGLEVSTDLSSSLGSATLCLCDLGLGLILHLNVLAWAAISKYPQMASFKKQTQFLTVLVAETPKIKVPADSAFGEGPPPGWYVAALFLTVCSPGGERKLWYFFFSQGHSFHHGDSVLTISSKPDHHPTTLPPRIITFESSDFKIQSGRRHKHSAPYAVFKPVKMGTNSFSTYLTDFMRLMSFKNDNVLLECLPLLLETLSCELLFSLLSDSFSKILQT